MKLISKISGSRLAVFVSTSLLTITSVGVLALYPLQTFAISNSANEACQGVGLVSGNGCADNGTQLNTTLDVFINIFTAIVGLVAVIMIIVAGLQFITANAEPQNVAKARSSLLYAIVGLVVVVIAQVIVHFVITQASTAK